MSMQRFPDFAELILHSWSFCGGLEWSSYVLAKCKTFGIELVFVNKSELAPFFFISWNTKRSFISASS